MVVKKLTNKLQYIFYIVEIIVKIYEDVFVTQLKIQVLKSTGYSVILAINGIIFSVKKLKIMQIKKMNISVNAVGLGRKK